MFAIIYGALPPQLKQYRTTTLDSRILLHVITVVLVSSVAAAKITAFKFTLEWSFLSMVFPYEKGKSYCRLCRSELYMIIFPTSLILYLFSMLTRCLHWQRHTFRTYERSPHDCFRGLFYASLYICPKPVLSIPHNLPACEFPLSFLLVYVYTITDFYFLPHLSYVYTALFISLYSSPYEQRIILRTPTILKNISAHFSSVYAGKHYCLII